MNRRALDYSFRKNHFGRGAALSRYSAARRGMLNGFWQVNCLRSVSSKKMRYDRTYTENLRALIASLRTARDPDNWRIYAIIIALVHDVQSVLNREECIRARVHSDHLTNFLVECRAAVLGSCTASIDRAADCLTILEGAE
ncbi:MAG: hypothetical protein JWL59_4574 [Chthoniobacteraceae bacterium]|nr:hypothetical protein [Chthoniobacteraceae bacterium]